VLLPQNRLREGNARPNAFFRIGKDFRQNRARIYVGGQTANQVSAKETFDIDVSVCMSWPRFGVAVCPIEGGGGRLRWLRI